MNENVLGYFQRRPRTWPKEWLNAAMVFFLVAGYMVPLSPSTDENQSKYLHNIKHAVGWSSALCLYLATLEMSRGGSSLPHDWGGGPSLGRLKKHPMYIHGIPLALTTGSALGAFGDFPQKTAWWDMMLAILFSRCAWPLCVSIHVQNIWQVFFDRGSPLSSVVPRFLGSVGYNFLCVGIMWLGTNSYALTALAFMSIWKCFKSTRGGGNNSNGRILVLRVEPPIGSPTIESDKDETCSVCGESTFGVPVVVFPCRGKHKFHSKCIQESIKHNRVCPMCKDPLTP